jgi:hypothetical protein
MIQTNVYGLPAPYVQAVTYNSYDKVGRISITGLIKPPRIRILEKRHDAELTEDVSEKVWMLLGSAVHAVLERIDSDNHLLEERLTAEVDGWIISGKPDLLDPGGILTDWKVTSVFSFLLGDKIEWIQQLNYYKWLYYKQGFKITKLQIIAILRDWSKRRAQLESDYPKTAIHVVPITMLDIPAIEQELRCRVGLHKASENLPDDQLPECTAAERWERPTTYAVKKEANIKAFRVFEDEATAKTLLEEKGKGWIIEKRPGASIRCQEYCLVAPFCNQYQATLRKTACLS